MQSTHETKLSQNQGGWCTSLKELGSLQSRLQTSNFRNMAVRHVLTCIRLLYELQCEQWRVIQQPTFWRLLLRSSYKIVVLSYSPSIECEASSGVHREGLAPIPNLEQQLQAVHIALVSALYHIKGHCTLCRRLTPNRSVERR